MVLFSIYKFNDDHIISMLNSPKSLSGLADGLIWQYKSLTTLIHFYVAVVKVALFLSATFKFRFLKKTSYYV